LSIRVVLCRCVRRLPEAGGRFSQSERNASRVNQATRTFTPPPPTRHAKLAPFKDGIVELRQKGASLRLIRELLATVDVAVGTDTIARFLAEMNGDPMPQRPANRIGRHRMAAPRPVRHQPAVASLSPPATPQPSAPGDPPADATRSGAPAERSRMRGPRIADPSNL
jgi:hypothetical protein